MLTTFFVTFLYRNAIPNFAFVSCHTGICLGYDALEAKDISKTSIGDSITLKPVKYIRSLHVQRVVDALNAAIPGSYAEVDIPLPPKISRKQ